MKKFILFIAVITLSITSTLAEDYAVVSQNSTNESQTLPFDLNYAGKQRVQLIYPASKFSGSNSQSYPFTMNFIHQFTFNTSSAIANAAMVEETAQGSGTYRLKTEVTLAITIAECTQSNFISSNAYVNLSGSSVSNTQTLSKDNVSLTSNSLTITIPSNAQTGWIYNSTNNVLIDIQVNFTGDDNSNVVKWKAYDNVVTQSSYQSLYATYNDDLPTTGSQSSTLPALLLDCSRKFTGVSKTDNENAYTFEVYSECNGLTSYAVMKTCELAITGHLGKYYINPCQSLSNIILTPENAVPFNVYYLPEDVSCNLKGTDGISESHHVINITTLADDLSSNFSKTSSLIKSAFVFSSKLKCIGEGKSANNCFSNQISNSSIFIFNTEGNTNPPDFIGTGNIHNSNIFYVFDNCTTNIKTYSGWNNKLDGNTTGWCSHPYRVYVGYAYSNTANTLDCAQDINSGDGKQYIKVTQSPFGSFPLIVECKYKESSTMDIFTKKGFAEAAHDGTFHYYYKFDATNSTNSEGGATIDLTEPDKYKAVIKDRSTFNLYPLYYAELHPSDEMPQYKDGDGPGSASSLFTPRCDYLVFRVGDNSKAPKWTYEGTGSNDDVTAPLNTTLIVERQITSADYTYISLPFDCPVSNITVSNSEGTINFYDGSLETRQAEDKYVIFKYNGQKNGQSTAGEETAQFVPVTASETLLKNKGYAIAIFETQEHTSSTITATIKFKINTEKTSIPNFFGSKGYDSFIMSNMIYNGDRTKISELNDGWNLVGNPFFFPIKANSFGNNKYVAIINTGNTESKKVAHVRTDIQHEEIEPFEAFYLQVPDNSDITVNPKTVAPSQINTPYQTTANTKPEHLSVVIKGANNVSDRTTIITADDRDENFVIGDDMGKTMGSGLQFYSYCNSTPCIFKELPLRSDSSYTIPLGVVIEEAGNYTFALDTSLTMFWGAAMLHDKQNNQYHTLNENGVQISLSEGTNNSRFELVVVPSEIPAELEDVETSETLDAYVYDGHLVVENIAEGSTLSIYDISGKLVYSAAASGDFNYNFSAHGVYMVVLRGNTTGTIKVVY